MKAELTKQELLSRIVRIPDVCHGTPVIRGMRWPVYVVMGLIASGASHAEILEDHPELNEADLRACLLFASEFMQEHSQLLAAQLGLRMRHTHRPKDRSGAQQVRL